MSKIIFIGAGKMAVNIALHLTTKGKLIEGFTDMNSYKLSKEYSNYYLGEDDVIFDYNSNDVELIVALSDQYYIKKHEIYKKFKNNGYRFTTVLFDNVTINPKVEIGTGAIIFSSVNINSFSIIEDLVVVNSCSNIDHDNLVGYNSYICPGVITTGSVNIGKNVLIGSGAKILPNINIGNNSILGANSLLRHNIPNGEIWFGSPAGFKRKVNEK